MKTKILLLLILVTIVLFLVTGCGGGFWYKSDYDSGQFKKDAYECERDSWDAMHGQLHRGIYNRCMRSKGYEYIK